LHVLADVGADVIKTEKPDGGGDARASGLALHLNLEADVELPRHGKAAPPSAFGVPRRGHRHRKDGMSCVFYAKSNDVIAHQYIDIA
jgi:crotonobetainyl-CoA:carnitine CoA-transferase CaiB-like acyl-CoA transferase